MKVTLSPWQENLLLILTGIIIAIICLESFSIATGFAANDDYQKKHQYFYEFLQPDTYLGFKPRANLRDFRYNWDSDKTTLDPLINTDSYGFRNVGESYDETDIYVIGDSFAWGWGVARKDAFYGLLETQLDTPIVTFGVPAYGFEQYQTVFQDWAVSRKPKTVILSLYSNDLQRLKPQSDMENAYQRLGIVDYETMNWYNNSLIYKFLVKRKISQLFNSFFNTKKADNGLIFCNHQFMANLASGTSQHYLESTDHVQVEEALSELIEQAKLNNIELVIFCFPSKESANIDQYAQFFPKSIDYLKNETLGYERLCGIAQKEGVSCLDLTNRFRQKSSTEKLYFDVDGHWNPAGHRLAAEVMAETLSANEKN